MAKGKSLPLYNRICALPLEQFCSVPFVLRALKLDPSHRNIINRLGRRIHDNFLRDTPSITVLEALKQFEDNPQLVFRLGLPGSEMQKIFQRLLVRFDLTTRVRKPENELLSKEAEDILIEIEQQDGRAQ